MREKRSQRREKGWVGGREDRDERERTNTIAERVKEKERRKRYKEERKQGKEKRWKWETGKR